VKENGIDFWRGLEIGTTKLVSDLNFPPGVIKHGRHGVCLGINNEFAGRFGLDDQITIGGRMGRLKQLADNIGCNREGDISKDFVGMGGKGKGKKILGVICESGVFFDGNNVGGNFKQFPSNYPTAGTYIENRVRGGNKRISDEL